MPLLFTIPITTGGSFECTSPASQVYLLSFESPPDNRLTTPFINAFNLALDIIEQSNGLELKHFNDTPGFSEKTWLPFYERILTYPMPTIALINGHGFAGGWILAMFHDYRVQNPSRGFLCLNEIDIGMVISNPLLSIYREKVQSPNTYRAIVLEGKRFTAQQALQEGLVDAVGGLDDALKLSNERSLISKAKSGVWGSLKEGMYRETLNLLKNTQENTLWREEVEKKKLEKAKQGLQKIGCWEKNGKNITDDKSQRSSSAMPNGPTGLLEREDGDTYQSPIGGPLLEP
ncbi:ClpP/crotonase [Glonium stellatum]|uniref:ClpP/crotonase n=1 Tax=Glonium stellatum TaxID=574774 RepID=A0A8E2EN64_9PEZI|nr:ClpP/crotonase [Glonium stellatum]